MNKHGSVPLRLWTSLSSFFSSEPKYTLPRVRFSKARSKRKSRTENVIMPYGFLCVAYHPNSQMVLYQHRISWEFIQCIILPMLCSYCLTSLQKEVLHSRSFIILPSWSRLQTRFRVDLRNAGREVGIHPLDGTLPFHPDTFTHARFIQAFTATQKPAEHGGNPYGHGKNTRNPA